MKIFNILLFFLIGMNFAQAQGTKVAILDFENTSGKTEYDALAKAISSMLITDLANNIHPKKVEFFERSQLNKLLDEQKLQKSKSFDAKTAVDFGKLSGVNYVFVGSVFVLDGTCNFSSKLVDVQTSKILLAKEVSGTIVNFLQLKSQLAEAIAIQLNNPITLDPSYKEQSTTLSTINQYGKILTTMDQGDMDKAEQLRSVFQETTPDFKYFSDIKDEIERIKERVSELENVTDILTDNFDLGDKAEIKKDFKSAIKYFEKFINNPGNEGFVENKKVYAYSKLARCQFLTGDYANALINSRKAQLIYKYFPEANETELMSLIKLNLNEDVENKYSFIVDSLTFRNEQNFRRQEKNEALVWESIDGLYFGLLPVANSDTWVYSSLQKYGYASSAENEVKIKKLLITNGLKLLESKNTLSNYEKMEAKLLSFNDSLVFMSDQILNFYKLSLVYAEELFQAGQIQKYKKHLVKEIERMVKFGVPCDNCYRSRRPINHDEGPSIRVFLWDLGLTNSARDFLDNFHLIYGDFVFRHLIVLVKEGQIQEAALLYQKTMKEKVKERDSYFYSYYWDIILGLRVISEDNENSTPPLSSTVFEKKLDKKINIALENQKILLSNWTKVKLFKIEANSEKVTMEVDKKIGGEVDEIYVVNSDGEITEIRYAEPKDANSLIWSKNIGLVEDMLGNKIKLATEQEMYNYYKDSVPAYCYYDFDEVNGEKYGKLYNYWALQLLLKNPPIGWRIANLDDYYSILCGQRTYNCYDAESKYIETYPDVKNYFRGAAQHYIDHGEKEGKIWDSKICFYNGEIQIFGLYNFSPSGYSNINGGFNAIDLAAKIWTYNELKGDCVITLSEISNVQITNGSSSDYYAIRMVKSE